MAGVNGPPGPIMAAINGPSPPAITGPGRTIRGNKIIVKKDGDEDYEDEK